MWDEALAEYCKALPIFQNHELTAGVYHEMGTALCVANDHEEALVEQRQALEIYGEVLGEDHESTANCYESIGSVFLKSGGQPDDALIRYVKALAIRLRLLGKNNTDTAYGYCNIGIVLEEKGEYDDAILLPSLRSTSLIILMMIIIIMTLQYPFGQIFQHHTPP